MDDTISTAAEAIEADALPRLYEAHCSPDESSNKGPNVPDCIARKPVTQKSPAQWAYERTVLYLRNFEEQLDNEHEVAMGFVGGNAGVLRIEGMGYFDPDIVTFYGTDAEGGRTQLVQHVSQLSVIFRALPKARPGKAPNRIGFRLVEDLEKAQAATS
ncbi:DUF6173 family protein [Marimonas sp. MJW-29]|uniref:DUF6173 family protein n=1 Tax=Sulfitobacter sediminis TaxID=3234186 RepID=A0ABV3RL54_9RHOB